METHPPKIRSPIRKITIVGAGSIGTAWAIVFATAGLSVSIQDSDTARLDSSRHELQARLSELKREQLLPDPPINILSRVRYCEKLLNAVQDADYVQECIIENLPEKQALFQRLENEISATAIIASSSSFIPPSQLYVACRHPSRCLVVHPGNPPYLLRIVEVIPSPATDDAVVRRVMDLMTEIDMNPVRVNREIEGFVFNRLQGAMLREAYALVRDGVVSMSDIDRLVRNGLGLRWSIVGPFETIDLNTRGGIATHAERMLPAYRRMGRERGEQELAWPKETLDRVIAERRAALPLSERSERVAWRDRELMKLLAHRRQRKLE